MLDNFRLALPERLRSLPEALADMRCNHRYPIDYVENLARKLLDPRGQYNLYRSWCMLKKGIEI